MSHVRVSFLEAWTFGFGMGRNFRCRASLDTVPAELAAGDGTYISTEANLLTKPYTEYSSFIETRGFTEKLRALVDDEAYRTFQNELLENPEAGDLIKGAGGIRKVRMRLPGRGKSGGARVIYLYLENHAILYFLAVYTKKEQSDLTPDQKKALCTIVEGIKRVYRNRV